MKIRLTYVKAAKEIANLLGEDAVSYDSDDIEVHGFSDWSSINSTGRALAVIYPKTTDQVAKAARVCHQYRVPIGNLPLLYDSNSS